MQDTKDTDCVVLAVEVELDGCRVPRKERRVCDTLAKNSPLRQHFTYH
jgi:hypothetical protein